nr:MAG TPA: hypothetical protein [Caudoviricetes sp.]
MLKFSTNIQMKFGIRETRLTFLFSERTYFSIFQTFNFINIL